MTDNFYFTSKQQIADYCDEQLAKLKAMNCEDALDDGCDNENADQNRRFCDFTRTAEQMVQELGMFEFKASKVLDREKMKHVWCEAVSNNSKVDEYLRDYYYLVDYYTNIKKL